MDRIERIFSKPAAKPYRSKNIRDDSPPFLNRDGHLDFAPNDIENPQNWSTARRWYIAVVAVLLVVNSTFASSSPSGCLPSISEELHVSREVAGLVITLYLLGYSFGPLLWAPLSEFYGRRWIFHGTFTCYVIFNFLCAFTPNFAGLLVGRFLTGTFASAALSNSPGVLADVFNPIERGNAMAIFSCMTFVGPSLGPVIGGFLQLNKDFRWDFYVLLWLGGGTLFLLFTIPETLPSQVLVNKARRLRRAQIPGYENVQAPAEVSGRSLGAIFKVTLIRPWIILFDPISFLVAIYTSVVYVLLYMLFTIYPIVFEQHRGWNAGVGELPLIGTVVGAMIGGVIVFWDSHKAKLRQIAGIRSRAEDRLYVAMIGGVMFPITMFFFAWTANFNSIPWIVPVIAGTLLSTAIMLIFVAYLNYLTDAYLMYTSSAMAANTICRSACGAAAPLFTEQMFRALGIGGGGSLIAGVACLLAPIPFVFWKYGEPIRKRSRFAPTPELPEGADDEEKATGNVPAESSRRSSHKSLSSAEEAEKALDEEMGLPSSEDLNDHLNQGKAGNDHGNGRYLDASGLERAEDAPTRKV